MKSGEHELIDPGDNNYGRDDKSIKGWSPELMDKFWKGIKNKIHDQEVSKEHVLHHLKQLKSQMGKIEKQVGFQNDNTQLAIRKCIKAVSDKIEKIKNI